MWENTYEGEIREVKKELGIDISDAFYAFNGKFEATGFFLESLNFNRKLKKQIKYKNFICFYY